MNQTETNLARIRAYNKALDAEWDESKHPRAANGQFGSGGSKSASQSNSDFKRKIFLQSAARSKELKPLLAKSRAGNASKSEEQRINELLTKGYGGSTEATSAPAKATKAPAKGNATPAAKSPAQAKNAGYISHTELNKKLKNYPVTRAGYKHPDKVAAKFMNQLREEGHKVALQYKNDDGGNPQPYLNINGKRYHFYYDGSSKQFRCGPAQNTDK